MVGSEVTVRLMSLSQGVDFLKVKRNDWDWGGWGVLLPLGGSEMTSWRAEGFQGERASHRACLAKLQDSGCDDVSLSHNTTSRWNIVVAAICLLRARGIALKRVSL